MNLPDTVRRGVEETLGDTVAGVQPVGGGCINPAARITTGSGADWFLKWNEGAPADAFRTEAAGLRALAAPGALRVPEVAGVGADGASWLLLEYVRTGTPAGDYAERLGHGLADLHRHGAGAADRAGVEGAGDASGWGWAEDNRIGSLPQANEPAPTWGAFWRDRRIGPQLRLARERGFLLGDAVLDRVVDATGALLEPAERDGPSLLHGDLWGGNVMVDQEGRPVLVDPAVYRGHREVDLAMSELFGGFPRGFMEAYDARWPLLDGYRRGRRPLYQLYYLLVHVNLFGASYVGRTLQAARAALDASG